MKRLHLKRGTHPIPGCNARICVFEREELNHASSNPLFNRPGLCIFLSDTKILQFYLMDQISDRIQTASRVTVPLESVAEAIAMVNFVQYSASPGAGNSHRCSSETTGRRSK